MIAVDTNLLVYAHRRDAALHAGAFEVVGSLAEGRGTWAIPWPCVHEFLAVVTHPRVYDPPSTVPQAIEQMTAWMDSPAAVLLGEGAGYWLALAEIVEEAGIVGAKVHDARVAAICAVNGVRELWTLDRDFSRLGIRVRNPLAG